MITMLDHIVRSHDQNVESHDHNNVGSHHHDHNNVGSHVS